MRTLRLAIASVVLLGATLAGAGEFRMPPAYVTLGEVIRVDMSPEMWIPGTVLSRQDAKIAAEIAGRLVWVAEPGDEFSEGEAFARIDDRELQLDLQDNEANILRFAARVKFLRADVGRLRQLTRMNSAARTEFDERVSEHEMAIQDLAKAKIARNRVLYSLERTDVGAPFAGQLVERLLEPGEFTSVGRPLARLVNLRALEVRAQAPIRVAPFLEKGMSVTVKDDERSLVQPITTIIPVGDTNSRSFEIRLAVPPDLWVIGSPVRVGLPTERRRTVAAVPRDALILRERATYVFRVNGEGKAERIVVQIGIGAGELIEITGDVDVGDRVVVRGGESLRDGQSVEINPG